MFIQQPSYFRCVSLRRICWTFFLSEAGERDDHIWPPIVRQEQMKCLRYSVRRPVWGLTFPTQWRTRWSVCVSWVHLRCTALCVCCLMGDGCVTCTVSVIKELCMLWTTAAEQPGGHRQVFFSRSHYVFPWTQVKTPKDSSQGLCVMLLYNSQCGRRTKGYGAARSSESLSGGHMNRSFLSSIWAAEGGHLGLLYLFLYRTLGGLELHVFVFFISLDSFFFSYVIEFLKLWPWSKPMQQPIDSFPHTPPTPPCAASVLTPDGI